VVPVISQSSANFIQGLVRGWLGGLAGWLASWLVGGWLGACIRGCPPVQAAAVPCGCKFALNHLLLQLLPWRAQVEDALAKGATPLTGPFRREGNLIWPVLLDNVTNSMRLAWEEVRCCCWQGKGEGCVGSGLGLSGLCCWTMSPTACGWPGRRCAAVAGRARVRAVWAVD